MVELTSSWSMHFGMCSDQQGRCTGCFSQVYIEVASPASKLAQLESQSSSRSSLSDSNHTTPLFLKFCAFSQTRFKMSNAGPISDTRQLLSDLKKDTHDVARSNAPEAAKEHTQGAVCCLNASTIS